MQAIKIYLYNNKLEVQITDSSVFIARNRQVYSRPIKIYQGIDNPIQVVIKNQDQKLVSPLSRYLQVTIQDPTNKVEVESFNVTLDETLTGYGSFTIPKSTVDALDQRFYKLSCKTIESESELEQPAYVDDNYGVLLDLEVLPAYYAAA